MGDYAQTVVGADATFAWRHWQIWEGGYAARFETPRVGNADTLPYYIEAKYKFAPQWFGAMRWGQRFHGEKCPTGEADGAGRSEIAGRSTRR